MEYILVIVLAYLIGSLNFAIVFSKLFKKFDIREFGSKNAGSTNVLRVMGKNWAIAVLTCDISKAIIAVLIAGLFTDPLGKLLAGIAVILGHAFPVYFKFKGGKGVASGAGFFIAFDWRVFLILFVVFFIVVLITKMVSLSSIIASISLPIGMYIFYGDWIFVLIGLLITLGIIYLHRTNIVRIIHGEENKISFKKK